MKSSMILGGAAVLVAAGVAGADYKIDFEEFIAAGGEFTTLVNGADVSGTLTGVTADFVLYQAGDGLTWADDLTVLIGGAVQIGGFSDQGTLNPYAWGTGSSGTAGTLVQTSFAIDPNVDVTGLDISLGNGYNAGGNGYWTGSITLEGITVVPAPGAIALLGLGGLVARRRRG